MYGNNSICDIGNDCMFSNQIELYTGDGHKILNKTSREILNYGSITKIGNHVWIGRGATICKNTIISDHSIIGTRAVVTKQFTEKNIVNAGNPATKVKDNIDWDDESNY